MVCVHCASWALLHPLQPMFPCILKATVQDTEKRERCVNHGDLGIWYGLNCMLMVKITSNNDFRRRSYDWDDLPLKRLTFGELPANTSCIIECTGTFNYHCYLVPSWHNLRCLLMSPNRLIKLAGTRSRKPRFANRHFWIYHLLINW